MVFDKSFIINWNNNFPLDKWYREKYSIPFNSKKHRRTSYIDIYLEYYEEKLFERGINITIEEDKRAEEYRRTGQWFVPVMTEEDVIRKEREDRELEEAFDNIDISAFNNMGDE